MKKLILAGLLAAIPMLPANIVQNGGFEDELNNWSVIGDPADIFAHPSYAQVPCLAGAYCGSITGLEADGLQGFSQMLTTVPTATYSFALWVRNPFGGTNELFVSVGGETLLSVTDLDAFDWTFFVLPDFQATGPTAELKILGQNTVGYFHIDDVQSFLIKGPSTEPPRGGETPEPGTIGLVGAGLAIVGWRTKRHRRPSAGCRREEV